MHVTDDLLALLKCPQSGGKLENQDGLVYSPDADIAYSSYSGIPWLFRNSDVHTYQWQQNVKSFLMALERDADFAEELARSDELLKSTQERFKLIRKSNAHNINAILEILESFVARDEVDKPESKKYLMDKLPTTQHINSYLQTIFRDWAWGEKENSDALERVGKYLPKSADSIAVLGSGAGRLAFDIHQKLTPKTSIAIDISPILQLTARRVIFDKPISLYELAVAPLELDDYRTETELKCPEKVKPGFNLLFADAINLPLQDNSMDAIVTPWFIDIISDDIKNLSARINNALKPGGVWINFGPLGYSDTMKPQSYSAEELEELTQKKGFTDFKSDTGFIDYLVSPNNSSGRKEKVLCFSCKKDSHTTKPIEYFYLPEWIRNRDEVIPRTTSLTESAIKSKVYFEVFELIDGKRTQEDVCKLMVEKFGMQEEMAQESLVTFLTQIFEGRI